MASQIRLSQGEADMLDELHSTRMKVRLAHTRNGATRTAGSDPIHRPACTPAGRSLPSGSAPDWRVTALALAASVVVLPVALAGYIGIVGAVRGWEFITKRGRK